MQSSPQPASTGPATGGPSSTTRLSHALAVGVVAAGTGLLAAGPVAPAAGDIAHRALHLINEAGTLADNATTWSEVIDNAQHNLTALQQIVADNPSPILSQIAENQQDYAQLITGMEDVQIGFHSDGSIKTITSGFQGLSEGLQAMLNGSAKAPGLQELLQIMSTDIQNGDTLGAFNEFNLWSLFGQEGVLKPLVPMVTIPQRMMENFTNVFSQTIGPETLWGFGKAINKSLMEPLIGVGYQLSEINNQVSADFTDGDTAGAMSVLNSAPAQLTDTLLNGYQVPDSDNTFIGLLSAGGTLQSLLVTWPQQIADALTVGTADLPVNAADDTIAGTADVLAGTAGPGIADLFTGF